MIPRFSPALSLSLSASALLLTSCRKPEVREYLAPRDATPAPAASTAAAPREAPSTHPEHPAAQSEAHQPPAAKPKIAYTLPAGWEEAPAGDVSIAAFTVKSDAGEASINITPMPDLRGRESLIVNMYRQQTGQPPIEQADWSKDLVPVEAAGGPGQLLELLGSNRGKPIRLITVIAHRDGRSWFYRISGDDTFVTAQKPVFLEFLKSVHIAEPAAAESTTSGAPAPEAAPAPPAVPAVPAAKTAEPAATTPAVPATPAEAPPAAPAAPIAPAAAPAPSAPPAPATAAPPADATPAETKPPQ